MVAGVDRTIDWLAYRASTTPERLAIVSDTERWTFATLDERVNTLAYRLATLGVSDGQRVAILLSNSPVIVELVHAIGRLGAILVPLNVRLTPDELIWQIDDVGARLLLYDSSTAEKVAVIRTELPEVRAVTVDEPGGSDFSLYQTPASHVLLRDRIDFQATHSIIYTSGTTGLPKGAMISYGNLWWSAIGSALNLGNQPDDRWLACLPLFHVGGLSILFRGVIYGITAQIHGSFDPVAVNRAIDEEGVTIVSVVATMLRRMLAAHEEQPYPASLRCVLLGGGPAPRPLLEECSRLRVPVVQTYGLTETASQVATLAPEQALRKLGSAGKPLFPNEVRIVADGWETRPGEPGEIQVRGPIVTGGYFGRPDATERAIDDGWLRTGDIGHLDEEGYLYVLDRRDDLIVSGGENVYPAEVEAVLLAHPLVEDAGVIGVRDDEWGQRVVAAVQFRPERSVSEGDLRAFCRERLAAYKVPSEIRFLERLPRNAAGKLLRRSLRIHWSSRKLDARTE
ncbi:MAG: o-succinylbenzoate--CoA ligase [Thermomicrobiales bacterium]|nr:o-succinylbenzoate--CoA ligase [Thermomicrobiales bacterium]